MNKEEVTKTIELLSPKAGALSVLSYPPTQSNSWARADFNLMPLA